MLKSEVWKGLMGAEPEMVRKINYELSLHRSTRLCKEMGGMIQLQLCVIFPGRKTRKEEV